MSRHHEQTPDKGITSGSARLQIIIRRMLTTVAIPSILTACASAPPIESGSGHSMGPSDKTIFYVRARPKSVEKNDEVAASPADKYIPLPSDVPIIESIVAKHKLDGKAAVLDKQSPQNVATDKRVGTRSIALTPSVSPLALKDGIWERMRKRLMLTAVEHESVAAEVEKIEQSPAVIEFLARRAEPFLFYIVDEIERHGLLMDLALVPMVESAFEPTAVSPKEAAGIWQFIPGTATDYGLKMVEGYDGRFDIYASTKAALKHLSRLQGVFNGDWLLALAAYNAGEGAVQKAIAANQKARLGTGFWDLDLPSETKAYVPKILALSRIIADPNTHGIKLRKISALPYLARVEVNSTAPLAQLVTGTGMRWEDFYGLNPAFKSDVPPSADHFNLLLPLDKAERLAASLPGAKLIAARKYVVKKGETLTVIAKHEGVNSLKLAEWNGLKADSRVKPGQELIIYPIS